MKKKLISWALTAALAVGCLVVPVGALGAFSDLEGLPAVRENAEILHQLGIVNGKPGGVFDPYGTFTRAEFCKMALITLGREGEAALQTGRVIFTDVTAGHWALGYINAAASVTDGAQPLVRGKGNGMFEPNAPITCGEAVTILMRCLGYSDQELGAGGSAWYTGAMARAENLGLLEGVNAPGSGPLTRWEAAQLFRNLLFTAPKGGGGSFLTAVLGGSVTSSQLLLEVRERSGGGCVLVTDQGTYPSGREDLGQDLVGRRAALVLDQYGDVLALIPDGDYTTRQARVLSAQARYLTIQGQEQVMVKSTTPVWLDGEATTYGQVYLRQIPYGARVVLCYDRTDTLVSITLLTAGEEGAVAAVCTDEKKPFGDIAAQDAAVYKNGVPADWTDVKRYDVGVYDSEAGIMQVFDRKITGIYENAAPSPMSPETITLLGHTFPVADSAVSELAQIQPGSAVTLLLDGDNRVCGVVKAESLTAQALGRVSQVELLEGRTYSVTVELALGFAVQGQVTLSPAAARQALGQVAAASLKGGELVLSWPESGTVGGAWSVQKGTLGALRVSPKAAIYDKTELGPLVAVSVDQVTVDTAAKERILFLHTDNAGIVDLLVLDDITGEGYTYGVVGKPGSVTDYSDGMETTNETITVKNAQEQVTLTVGSGYRDLEGRYYGVAPSLTQLSGVTRLGNSVALQALPGVRRTAFGPDSVTVSGITYPLAANLDQCCYNAKAGTWFASLDEALAYAVRLTLYYDRAPSLGGKVRMVVVE